MKKLQLVANGEFKILNQALPQLHKGESIIKLSHVGICSSDINRAFRKGAYSYPLVMGHEAMGYVYDAKGEFAPGDKVVIFPLKPCFKCGSCKKGNFQTCSDYSYYGSREDGAYQEYLTVKDWNLIKISKAIKDSDAALIEPTSVMVHVKNKLQELLDMNNGLIKSEGAIIGGGFLAMILSKILLMAGIPNHEIF
jgi:L-iditol 2-dehydrogenase